jgi:hypothetical protein
MKISSLFKMSALLFFFAVGSIAHAGKGCCPSSGDKKDQTEDVDSSPKED